MNKKSLLVLWIYVFTYAVEVYSYDYKQGLGINIKKNIVPETLDHVSCSFDDFKIPCKWSNELSETQLVNISNGMLTEGEVDGYHWHASSYWFYLTKIKQFYLNDFIYSGNLLLIVHVHFKSLPKITTETVSNSFEEQYESMRSEIDLSNQLNSSEDKFEFTNPAAEETEISNKSVQNTPIEIQFREYHSPILEITQESCISFKLRGDTLLSRADFLNLWANDLENHNGTLLWSHYGPHSKIWQHYSVGLFPGNYTLAFNGSIFVRSRVARLIFAYEIDEIKVRTSPCDLNEKKKQAVHESGLMKLTASPYSQKMCTWISFLFTSLPVVNIKVASPNIDAKLTVTHISRSGVNVCIEKKHSSTDQDGWKEPTIEVEWSADVTLGGLARKVHSDLSFPLQKAPIESKIYPLPSLPNEKNYGLNVPLKFDKLGGTFLADTGCAAGQFQCISLACIPSYQRCDGKQDCEGGEDELNCKERYGYVLLSALAVSIVLSMLVVMLYYTCMDQKISIFPNDQTTLLSANNRFSINAYSLSKAKKFQTPNGVKGPASTIETVD